MSGVYTIDPGQPFLRVLAQGLILDLGDGLADALVLLPSRRACAALRETFAVVAGGRPMLLPRLEPVAEVAADEVLHGGRLRLVECLHCDHRWTERPARRWAELGAAMGRSELRAVAT